METKTFEVRDEGTIYIILAVKYDSRNEREHALLKRAGLGECRQPLVQLTDLTTGETHRDRTRLANKGRTIRTAHQHIVKEWDYLVNGQVIDVAYLLGESPEPVNTVIMG